MGGALSRIFTVSNIRGAVTIRGRLLFENLCLLREKKHSVGLFLNKGQ